LAKVKLVDMVDKVDMVYMVHMVNMVLMVESKDMMNMQNNFGNMLFLFSRHFRIPHTIARRHLRINKDDLVGMVEIVYNMAMGDSKDT
jgi:hypothetical protein